MRRLSDILLLLVLVAAAGLAGLGGLAPAPAVAAAGGVRLQVTDLSPAAVHGTDTLQVTGSITNTGTKPVRLVAVRLRLSASRLNSRSELAAVLAEKVPAETGDVLVESSLPDLAAGATSPFSLSRSLTTLTPRTGFGVYALTIEVTGTRSATGSTANQLAQQPTAVPWLPAAPDYSPTGFSWLWPLAGAPSRLANDTFADDTLAVELAPGGRLARLLDAGARLQPGTALTWALDPELVESVARMAAPGGYRVVRAGGGTSAGTGGPLAAAWLSTLQGVTAGADVVVLPYADPDVTALVHQNRRADVTAARTAGAAVMTKLLPGARLVTDLGWPTDGYSDRSTLSSLADSGVTAAVLDGRALPPTIDLSYTPSGHARVAGVARVGALLADPGLADLLAAAASGQGSAPVLGAQRVVAETAMITSELPGTGTARTIVTMPPRRWAPAQAFLDHLVAALPTAPWAAPISLTQLAATPVPAVARTRLRYPGTRRSAELPADYLRAMEGYAESTNTFASILTDRTKLVPGLVSSRLRLESSWWRGRDGRAIRLDREQTYLRDLRAAVRVQPGSFTFGSSSGTIPITLVNDLPQEVHVTLRLQALTPQLRLEPVTMPPLGPRQKVQVEVQASAVAGGRVVVEAALETPTGAAYGQPVQLPVDVTQIGAVALIITVGAAVVLFLTAGYRVIRRVRAAAAAVATAVGEPAAP